MAFVFVQGLVELLRLCVLLGIAEAGLSPGIVLYLTYWIPARQRAKIGALFMTAIPAAMVWALGSPRSCSSSTGTRRSAGRSRAGNGSCGGPARGDRRCLRVVLAHRPARAGGVAGPRGPRLAQRSHGAGAGGTRPARGRLQGPAEPQAAGALPLLLLQHDRHLRHLPLAAAHAGGGARAPQLRARDDPVRVRARGHVPDRAPLGRDRRAQGPRGGERAPGGARVRARGGLSVGRHAAGGEPRDLPDRPARGPAHVLDDSAAVSRRHRGGRRHRGHQLDRQPGVATWAPGRSARCATSRTATPAACCCSPACS